MLSSFYFCPTECVGFFFTNLTDILYAKVRSYCTAGNMVPFIHVLFQQIFAITGHELRCSGRIRNSCSTSDTRHVTVKQHEHHLIWKPYWTPVYVNNYKYMTPTPPHPLIKQMGVKTSRTPFLRGNCIGTKTWRHVIWQHEQREQEIRPILSKFVSTRLIDFGYVV